MSNKLIKLAPFPPGHQSRTAQWSQPEGVWPPPSPLPHPLPLSPAPEDDNDYLLILLNKYYFHTKSFIIIFTRNKYRAQITSYKKRKSGLLRAT